MSTQMTTTIKDLARQEDVYQRFAEIMGEREARGYISSVLIAVANSPALQECDPISIISSALRAATLRLSCDPGTGQAYLVPFKGKCALLIGYKGIKDMALRTGQYRYLNIAKIYEGEEVIEERLTGMHSIEGKRTSKQVIGYLLYFELMTGYRKSFYMDVEEIRAHGERYSKSYSRTDSLWKTNFDDMAKKTVIRMGLGKWGYFNPMDQMALNQIEAANESGEMVDGETFEVQEPAELEPPKSNEQILSELGF